MNHCKLTDNGKPANGFTLVELLVVVALVGMVIFAVNKIFGAIYIAYQDAEDRIKMQRDLKAITYHLKQDLTGLSETERNFDILNDGSQCVFICADDPRDTDDWINHTDDGDFDTFVYQLQTTAQGGRILRRIDKYGLMTTYEKSTTIALDSLDDNQDSFVWIFSMRHTDGTSSVVSDYDNTPMNFERPSAVVALDITLRITKKRRGPFRRNMPFLRDEMKITASTSYARGR